MRRAIAVLAISFALAQTTAHAQFPVIGELSNSYGLVNIVNSLSVGPKLVGYQGVANDTVLLFNMNQTVYRTMVRPPVPTGWSYDLAMYITESLFDTDPSTIEYLTLKHDPDYYYQWVMVIREDGTVLFETDYNASIIDQGATGNIEHYQHPIYSSSAQGTYMVLLESDSTNTVVTNRIYSLPGQLPCISCNNLSVGGSDDGNMLPATTNFAVFPNPTSESAMIRYALPAGIEAATLVLFNAGGGEVRRWSVTNKDAGQVTVGDLAPGTYVYQLRTDQRSLGVQRSIVVR